MKRRFARLIASGFGVGHAPAAPGTMGSLAAAVAGTALLSWSPAALPVAAAFAAALGLWAVRASKAAGDPGWIVIDEVAGQWVAMLPLQHAGWVGPPLCFALFRLLDITKPGPVGWIDRHPGPVAVMADDLAAGAAAALVVLLLRAFAGVRLDL